MWFKTTPVLVNHWNNYSCSICNKHTWKFPHTFTQTCINRTHTHTRSSLALTKICYTQTAFLSACCCCCCGPLVYIYIKKGETRKQSKIDVHKYKRKSTVSHTHHMHNSIQFGWQCVSYPWYRVSRDMLWKCVIARKNQRMSWILLLLWDVATRRDWEREENGISLNASTARATNCCRKETEARGLHVTHPAGTITTTTIKTHSNLCHSNKYVAHMKNEFYRVQFGHCFQFTYFFLTHTHSIQI